MEWAVEQIMARGTSALLLRLFLRLFLRLIPSLALRLMGPPQLRHLLLAAGRKASSPQRLELR
jgi:hypothetical protein